MHTVNYKTSRYQSQREQTFKWGPFSRMEDSPSKLSVAELAGRFKGHIVPMSNAHDESPFRRKPPCSLRFPVREDDVQESDTDVVSTSPIKIRMKSSNIIARLQEAVNPLADGRRDAELEKLGGEEFGDDAVERRPEVHKQDPRANLALSPTTLLPSPKGAELNREPDSPPPPAAVETTVTPLNPTLRSARLSVEEEEQEEPAGFNSPPEGATLPNFHKTRVRLSFKRRPPTRQHRRSAGEEASLLQSPGECTSVEANGDGVLQCPDRVTLEEGEGEEDERRDSQEKQGARAKTPPEDEEETRGEEEARRPQQMDGGDAR